MDVSTRDHFEALYSKCDRGHIVFTQRDRVSAYFDVTRLDLAVKHVEREPLDLFFKVNVMDHDKTLARSPTGVGGVKEVAAVVSLHLDVDAAKGDKYLTQDKMLEALHKMPHEPSAVVLTNHDNGGCHAYWFLAEPYYILENDLLPDGSPNPDSDRKRVGRISTRWQRELKEFCKPGALDGTANIDRVLRPIDSLRESGNRVRALIWEPGRRYSLDDFTLPEIEPAFQSKPAYEGDKVIDRYLDAIGWASPEAILARQGYSHVRDGFWIRPGSQSGAPTGEIWRHKDGRLGFTVKSGGADPLECTNKDGSTGRWYSTAELFVVFYHGNDWKKAAASCHEYFESIAPKVDISAITDGPSTNDKPPETTPPAGAENLDASGHNPNNSREKGGFDRSNTSRGPNLATPTAHKFEPFPVDVFPSPLKEFIRQTATAICCDESFVAMPLLAGLASAIGNSTALRIKRGWSVPPIVWTVVLAQSGATKSAPLRAALRPIYTRQKRLLKEYDEAFKRYQLELEAYLQEKKSKEPGRKLPDQPVEPICQRCVVDDTTVEALAKRLSDNLRGLLSAKDELSGWFGGFNRYKNAATSDEPKWLEWFSAQTSIIDRSSSHRPIVIDRASVCVTGTIQPAILRKQLTSDHKASGLAARLLFAMPPLRAKQWTDFEVSRSVESAVNSLFDNLFAIPLRLDDDGSPLPNYIPMDEHAKGLFIRYYNRHSKEQQELDGELYAAYAKLEEYAARFALIFHCVNWAKDAPLAGDIGELSVDSMAAGIQLCEWFKNEAKRVYAVLSEDDLVAENRGLLNWLARQPEPVTANQLLRHHRSLGDSSTAERLLQSFVSAGHGAWESIGPTGRGGRPTRGFKHYAHGQNPTLSREIKGFAPDASEKTTPTGVPWNANFSTQ